MPFLLFPFYHAHSPLNLSLGIDLIAGGRKCGHKTREAPKSDNIYLALLVKVFPFVTQFADA